MTKKIFLIDLVLVIVAAGVWFWRGQETREHAMKDGQTALADKDYPTAARLLTIAGDNGNAKAQRQLGDLYSHGLGVKKDNTQAQAWYRKAAVQGDAWAELSLGGFYAAGRGGVKQDFGQAAYWYQKAAEKGNPEAQVALAGLYAAGRGVPQDYSKALAWYRKAAALSDASAEDFIGYYYEQGWAGLPKSYAQAFQWHLKAALKGDPQAEKNVGYFYEMGLGVKRDYARARRWYEKAAAQGDPTANVYLRRLKEKMGD